MTKNQIRDAIRRYLESSLRAHGFHDGDDLFTKGFVNSLQAAKLTAFIERTFAISIRPDDRVRLRTLNAIVDYVHRMAELRR